jgi:membrane protein
LRRLDWVGFLREEGGAQASRYVLLVEPAATPAGPLLNRLLVQREATTSSLWAVAGLDQWPLAALLPAASEVLTPSVNP